MSTASTLLGDVPLPHLLSENTAHGFNDWVIESYLADETLRSLCENAEKIRLIFCNARHALHPDGVQSEQECVWRKTNGACLHGEQWDSGLGIIRQFVQSARSVGAATPEELQYVTHAQNKLGNVDFYAHRNAPDVRQGKMELQLVENTIEIKQKDIGTKILEIRDAVTARVREKLDTVYFSSLTFSTAAQTASST